MDLHILVHHVFSRLVDAEREFGIVLRRPKVVTVHEHAHSIDQSVEHTVLKRDPIGFDLIVLHTRKKRTAIKALYFLKCLGALVGVGAPVKAHTQVVHLNDIAFEVQAQERNRVTRAP